VSIRNSLLVLLFCLAAFAATAAGDGDRTPVHDPSVTVRIEIRDRSELARLTRMISIEDVRGNEVRAVATARQLEAVEAAGWSWQILPAPVKAQSPTMCGDGWAEDDNRSWNCYPSYQQYEALMLGYAAKYHNLCRLVELGPTANTTRPHRLLALVISDNPDHQEDEPEVLLTSSMHGDETSGFALMLRVIDHLIRDYGVDPDVSFLVDETEIWINPLANPDGTYFQGDDTVAGAIRFFTTDTGAASAVDANRNFPDFNDDNHPDGNPWWPETEAMMALAETRSFALSANFHDGAEVVNYPWDSVPRRHPDDLWFQALARDWADLAQSDSPGGYLVDFDNGITNGWDWYETHGSRQDFVTFFHGGREVTIELSKAKLLRSEMLDDMWQWNRRALLDFVAHAHRGIRGVVTDPSGKPLAATIKVLGLDREEDGSKARTDPAVGDFHRLLLPGLYDLRIEATGYRAREIRAVAVVDGEATEIEVVLNPVLVRRPTGRRTPAREGNAAHGLQR
jgi:hypothetical protein